MSTDLTLPARAAVALRSAERETKLKELAVASASITVITNDDGYKQCHSARMLLKNTRVAIEKDSKAARDDAVAFNKATLAEERRLIGLIEPEEARLENLQNEWDAAREREKQARIEAELRRVANLQERVAELRGNRLLTAGHGSKFIAEHISDVESIPVNESFEEFRQQAEDAKAAGLSWLHELHGAALAHEAEQERIKAEREELARLRAEQSKRDAEERARIAEEERQAKIARDAEAARQAEQLRRQREELAEQERQQKVIRDAEDARLRAERVELERQQAEQRRQETERAAQLAAERQAFERQQAEARRQQEEAEAQQREIACIAAIKKPADTELIWVLADHYRVPAAKVHEWLRAMKLTQSEVA